MAFKDKIDIILQKRHEKAKQLIQRKEEILQLRDFLESSKNELNRKAWNIENEEMKKQYTDFFRKIDTTEIRQTSEDLADAIDAAVQRFSRDYLSIATVGKERQGKSCLLQSIGGFGTSQNRDISKWLFYLVNKICTGTNNNEKTVGLFLKEVIDRGFAVADARIIDSSDLVSVQDEFMISLLEKLIENITVLEGMEELQKLSFRDNKVSDISVIKNFWNLQEIWLADNPVEDYSPLEELPDSTVVHR